MIALGVIAAAFVIFYMNLNKYGSFIFRLADSLFIIGLIYLLIALAFYVRNVGFFKLLAYNRYRRQAFKEQEAKKQEADQDDEDGDRILELHEFYEKHYEKKWSNKYLLIYAIPLIILSYILSYFA